MARQNTVNQIFVSQITRTILSAFELSSRLNKDLKTVKAVSLFMCMHVGFLLIQLLSSYYFFLVLQSDSNLVLSQFWNFWLRYNTLKNINIVQITIYFQSKTTRTCVLCVEHNSIYVKGSPTCQIHPQIKQGQHVTEVNANCC